MEKRDIGPYLPFYMNQLYRYSYVEEPDTFTVWTKLTPERYARLDDFSIAKVQLQLRKLDSMTEEELIEIYNLDIDGHNSKYGDNPSKRYMANFARQNLKEYKVVHYLLSKGFDLFDLLPSNLAIDKNK